MGRPLAEARANKGSSTKTQTIYHLYNLDGSLFDVAYPSGDILIYTVGGAGRVTQLDDTLNTYATSLTYAPDGSLAGGGEGQHTSLLLRRLR
jgi:hypothetical protein